MSLKWFAVASFKIPGKFDYLEFKITSGNQCVDLYAFFTQSQIWGGLRFGEGYFRLDLAGNTNSFEFVPTRGTQLNQMDLTQSLNQFYTIDVKDISENTPVHLNLFCPFWNGSELEELFEIEFTHDKLPPVEAGTDRNEQKNFEYFSGMDPLSLVILLDAYFAGAELVPETVQISQIVYSKEEVVRVAHP